MRKLKRGKTNKISFRKKTIGLASAALASLCVGLAMPKAQDMTAYAASLPPKSLDLEYSYVLESELTEAEKALIVKEVPKYIENTTGAYLLVYRPKTLATIKQVAPKTGDFPVHLITASTAILVVLVIGLGVKGKKKILPLLLVAGLGGFVLPSTALAISNRVLASHDASYTIEDINLFPQPDVIEGYDYVGFIAATKEEEEKEITQTPSEKTPDVKVPDEKTPDVKVPDEKKPEVAEPTAPEVTVIEETIEDRQSLAFETKYEEDPSLERGKEVEIQAGVLGEIITTYTIRKQGGKELSRTLLKEERREPIPRIVKKGTFVEQVPPNPPVIDEKPTANIEIEERTETESIPFTTLVEETPRLDKGVEVVKQQGVNGTVTTTYRIQKVDGVVVSREVTNVETTPMVPHIIERGNFVFAVPNENLINEEPELPLAPLETEEISETQEVPFTTVYEDTPELKLGVEEIKQEGVNGQVVTTYRLHKLDGKVISREVIDVQTTEPTPKIMRRGVLQEAVSDNPPVVVGEEAKIDVIDDAVAQDLDFKITYVTNPDLPEGEERILVNGQKGSIITYYNVTLVNDEEVERVQVNQVTTPAVDQVVERGELTLKKPIVTIDTLSRMPESKSIDVTYTLEDETNSLISAKAKVYKNGVVVKEVAITDINQTLTITGLELYTDYVLKTEIVYQSKTGEQTSIEESTRDFTLEYKKIEFKDIDSIELYEKGESGFKRRLSLASLPADTSKFMVKIKSDKNKEAWLPVESFTPSEKDGQPTYEVKIAFAELVQERSAVYEPNMIFHVARQVNQDGVYHSFHSLVEAMKTTPNGNFILGADMSADEINLPTEAASYVTGTFTGTLTGEYNGKKFAIYNLAKPLLEAMRNGTVTGLDLKDVNINTNQSLVAPLAKTAIESVIRDVAVQGNVTATSNIGGIVANALDRTKVENVSYEGTLRSTLSNRDNSNVGGIAGYVHNNASVTGAKVNANIYTNNRQGGQRVGGIAGLVTSGAKISKAYTSGNLYNATNGGQNAGIVGSTWRGGIIDNVISEMNVVNGHDIYGDQAYDQASVTNAYTLKESKDRYANQEVLTKEAAKEKLDSFGISASVEDSSDLIKSNTFSVDYTKLENASADRAQAYENVEKLMPFYNKELVVYYGNKVAEGSKLYSTAIIDVVPMVDNEIVTDVYGNKDRINKLMIHYTDNTVGYIPLSFKEDFKNNQVIEYRLGDSPLIYAPEQFIASYDNIISRVLPDLKAIQFDSDEVRKRVDLLVDDDSNYGSSLKYLFLKDAFEENTADLGNRLRKVLAMDKAVNTMGSAVEDAYVEKIKENKVEILLGLSYLHRWYDINFGPINTKELTAYKFDFFGDNNVSTLDVLINLGKAGYRELAGSNNEAAYRSQLAPYKKQKDVFTYLDAYRQLFLPSKTNNEWLKENTKAYVVESKSLIEEVKNQQELNDSKKDSKYSVGVYDKITASNWRFRNMLLPLMTMKDESMYVISNMSTLSFGGYERYGSNIGTDTFKEDIRKKVDQAAIWQRDHQDFWYKVLNPEYREKLYRTVLNYDGFKYYNSDNSQSFRDRVAQDKSITQFFGIIGKWLRDNGSGAYADGNETNFIHDRILDQYGTSVYTHEMVHNSDGGIYFEGNGRRNGQGAEVFALGLLQNKYNTGDETFGINTMFTGAFDDENRVHTGDPVNRFTSAADLDQYMRGSLDVIYTLELLEGKSLLNLSDAHKKMWFRKMVNTPAGEHVGNAVTPLTDQEVSELKNFDDLITHNIITRRGYGDNYTWGRNGYHTVNMFAGNYAGIHNPTGAPGDVMFRRIAYELLAEKGYHAGFVPYVSNYYAKQGLPVNDLTVLSQMFNQKYGSWNEFKKDMYQRREEKAAFLKPITIRFELGKDNTQKTITLSSFEEMQALMDEAVALDFKNNASWSQANNQRSWVHKLKKKIFNAYIRQSNDFRESIYTN